MEGASREEMERVFPLSFWTADFIAENGNLTPLAEMIAEKTGRETADVEVELALGYDWRSIA